MPIDKSIIVSGSSFIRYADLELGQSNVNSVDKDFIRI